MPFKTTVNWLFNDIWCHLVIGCFNWKIGVFVQTVVRTSYPRKNVNGHLGHGVSAGTEKRSMYKLH